MPYELADSLPVAWITAGGVALAAVISGTVSFLVARITYSSARVSEEAQAHEAAVAARREYQYEALKRLYLQYEPVRFQMIEACEAARHKITELAALASEAANIDIGSIPKGRYLQAARVYQLLLPAAYLSMIRARLTLVDLALSPSRCLQYLLAKETAELLIRDAQVASVCRLTYTPYVADWPKLRVRDPQRYRRQGFARGRFENTMGVLVKDLTGDVLSFGEFELLFSKVKPGDFNSPLGAAADLFEDFNPATRPVLWRILLCQFVGYRFFDHAARTSAKTIEELPLSESWNELRAFGVENDLVENVGAVWSSGLERVAKVHGSLGDPGE